jgi:hypothetical protein
VATHAQRSVDPHTSIRGIVKVTAVKVKTVFARKSHDDVLPNITVHGHQDLILHL